MQGVRNIMDIQIEEAVKAVFDSRRKHDEAVARMKLDRETQQVAFTRQFLMIRETVIQPAMETFAKLLSLQGMESRITLTSLEEKGLPVPPGVIFQFLVASQKKLTTPTFPSVKFFGDNASMDVTLVASTTGPDKAGESFTKTYPVEAITERVVHDELVAVLEKIF
jgi:hypothetical protein